MTREQLKKLYPNASESFLSANCGAPSGAKPQPPIRHEPLAAQAREKGDSSRVCVRVTSFRKRLIDPDNLTPKFFIDCLRYCGLISNDTAQDISLTVEQKKSKDERTEIELICPST